MSNSLLSAVPCRVHENFTCQRTQLNLPWEGLHPWRQAKLFTAASSRVSCSCAALLGRGLQSSRCSVCWLQHTRRGECRCLAFGSLNLIICNSLSATQGQLPHSAGNWHCAFIFQLLDFCLNLSLLLLGNEHGKSISSLSSVSSVCLRDVSPNCSWTSLRESKKSLLTLTSFPWAFL